MRSFKNIAELIKVNRINHPKKYSQSELSHALGYRNGQFISNVERGLCSIPLKGIHKVSEVLNVPAEEVKNAILKDFEDTLDLFMTTKQVDRTKKNQAPVLSLN